MIIKINKMIKKWKKKNLKIILIINNKKLNPKKWKLKKMKKIMNQQKSRKMIRLIIKWKRKK